jgi:hypothetical protein
MGVDYLERESTDLPVEDDLQRGTGTVLLVAFHGPREGKYRSVQYSTVKIFR